MNIIKQSLKIFCTKIVYNLIIATLLLVSALSISDILWGISALKDVKQNELRYSEYTNYLYVQNTDLLSTETVFDQEFMFSPKFHTVYMPSVNLETTAKSYKFTAYDPFIFVFSEIELLSGRLPSTESVNYEFICPEGLFELGDTFDMTDNETFSKAEVVGIMTADSSIQTTGVRQTLNPEFYPFMLDSVYFEPLNRYDCVSVKREGVNHQPDSACYLEYPKEIYTAHKKEIVKDINSKGLGYISIGEVSAYRTASINSSIKTCVIIAMATIIPCIMLLILIYHNMLSKKSNVLGAYQLVGYSKQQINIILIVMALIYHLLAIIMIPLLNVIVRASIFDTSLIIILLMAPINAIGLIYALIAFNRKNAVDLIKEDSDK